MASKSDYYEKLKDPRWQKKRLEMLEAAGWVCAGCDCGLNDGKQFHVHHRYYVSGRDPWDYPPFAYAVLCSECHDSEHRKPDPDELHGPKEWEIIANALLRPEMENVGGMWDVFILFSELKGKIGHGAAVTAILDGLFRAWFKQANEFPAVWQQAPWLPDWVEKLIEEARQKKQEPEG